ncbi:hypothetical protein KAJ87_01515 [Candidatus Pacearchaeota archaeon]|nr:hypothetical protein [Candidatus Pacearchaeota archaeon]
MKKKKRGITIKLVFSNRWLYTFIVIGILAIIGVGVYALTAGETPDPGHNIQNIGPPSDCVNGQVLQFIDGAWGCVNLPGGETILKTKIVEIGNWDMNANSYVMVAHGLGSNYKKIRDIRVMIRRDDNLGHFLLDKFQDATDPVLIMGGVYSITSVNIVIQRRTDGHFDRDTFEVMGDDGNRGWIYIVYEE